MGVWAPGISVFHTGSALPLNNGRYMALTVHKNLAYRELDLSCLKLRTTYTGGEGFPKFLDAGRQ